MGPEVSTSLSPQKKDSPTINSQQAIKLWYFNKVIIHKPNNLKERGFEPVNAINGFKFRFKDLNIKLFYTER